MADNSDITTSLIQGLLANAPTQADIDELKQRKQGALSNLGSAYTSSPRPEDYSPFQEMVATYLQNMRPGFPQIGLGPAVAAPYFSNMREAAQMREEDIKRRTTELKDATDELRNQTQLQRMAILAGARMGQQGSRGMWTTKMDPAGNLVKTHGLTGETVIIPGPKIAQWNKIYEDTYKIGIDRGDPDAHDKATEAANAAVGSSPVLGSDPISSIRVPLNGPVTRSPPTAPSSIPSSTTIGRPAPAAPFTTGAVPDASVPTTDRVASLANASANTGVKNEAGKLLSDLSARDLPKDTLTTIGRLLSRAEGSQDPDLQKNTLSTIQKILSDGGISLPTEPASEPTAPLKPTPLISPREAKQNTAAGDVEGKKGAEQLIDYRALSTNASTTRAQLGLLRDLFNNPDMPAGQQADKLQWLRSTLQTFGVPGMDKPAGAAQIAEALATNFALHQRKQNGENMLPGAMSNYEDQLLRSMVPGLIQTPEGRMALVDYMDDLAASNQRVAAEAMRFAKANRDMLTPQWNYRAEKVGKVEAIRMAQRFREIADRFNLNVKEPRYGE